MELQILKFLRSATIQVSFDLDTECWIDNILNSGRIARFRSLNLGISSILHIIYKDIRNASYIN